LKVLRLNTGAARVSYPNAVIYSFEVRPIDIDALSYPVRPVPAFAENIRDSITSQGLLNPVVVIRGPREDIVRFYDQVGWAHDWLPDSPVVNIVCGGTNRVYAARELGYTHIDCVLVPDPYIAMRMQTAQRSSYEPGSAEEKG
jgi:hypothetical protein